MAETKVPALVTPSVQSDPQTRRAIASLIEALEIRLGRRGDPKDRAVTLRDLIDGGLIELAGGKVRVNPGIDVGGGGGPIAGVQMPTAPVGVEIDGGPSIVHLKWDWATYNGHSHTEIWRMDAERATWPEGSPPADAADRWVQTDPLFIERSDDEPNGAVLTGVAFGPVYADSVGFDKGYYYWLRHVNLNGVPGPVHATIGTFAYTLPSIAELIKELEDYLDATVLAQSLRERIDLIEGHGASIHAIETLQDDQASRMTQIQAQVDNSAAAIQTTQTAVAGLSASYTLKTDVNGHVAGYGLYNTGVESHFIVDATRFAIGSGGTVGYPFQVVSGAVYIKNANIQNASITSAKLVNVAANKIAAGTLTVSLTFTAAHITGGSLNINNLFIVYSNGSVLIRSALSGARTEQSSQAYKVFDATRLRVQLGNLNV